VRKAQRSDHEFIMAVVDCLWSWLSHSVHAQSEV